MGTDIHIFVEKRINQRWVSADTWAQSYEEPAGLRLTSEEIYNGRNYSLFAILANVRNGVGFAGIVTGEGFNYIDEPRGLPRDVCPEVKEEFLGWGCGAHSASHFTLAELLAFDWTQTTKRQGFCNLKEYADWIRYARRFNLGGPSNYCADISGQRIRKVSATEMDPIAERFNTLGWGPDAEAERSALLAKHDGLYCLAQWVDPYYRATSDFWSTSIPRLCHIAAEHGGLHNVRVVLWFDN